MKEPCPASGRWLDLEPPCTVSCPECGVDTAVTDRWSDGVKPASGVIIMDHSRELEYRSLPEGFVLWDGFVYRVKGRPRIYDDGGADFYAERTTVLDPGDDQGVLL